MAAGDAFTGAACGTVFVGVEADFADPTNEQIKSPNETRATKPTISVSLLRFAPPYSIAVPQVGGLLASAISKA